jgi:hypothetical protein
MQGLRCIDASCKQKRERGQREMEGMRQAEWGQCWGVNESPLLGNLHLCIEYPEVAQLRMPSAGEQALFKTVIHLISTSIKHVKPYKDRQT